MKPTQSISLLHLDFATLSETEKDTYLLQLSGFVKDIRDELKEEEKYHKHLRRPVCK